MGPRPRRSKRPSSSPYARKTGPSQEATGSTPSVVTTPQPSTSSAQPPEPTPSSSMTNVAMAPIQVPEDKLPTAHQPISGTENSPFGLCFQNTPPPAPSPSLKMGYNVDSAIRAKIIAGEYVCLSNLLKVDPRDQQQTMFQLNYAGELLLKPKQGPKIATMEQWLDAFIPFTSIYLAAHPDKNQHLLKYMNDVRLLGKNGGNFIKYDEQFRLKMTVDPTMSYDKIDSELWLMYNTNQGAQNATHTTPGKNKCYSFNYEGSCSRQNCPYAHLCLKQNCNKPHPMIQCTLNRPSFQQPRPQFPQPLIRPQHFNQRNQRPRNAFRSTGPRSFAY